MIQKKLILVLLSIICTAFALFSQRITVRIFSDIPVTSLMFTPFSGNYKIIFNDTLTYNIENSNVVHLLINDSTIEVNDLYGLFPSTTNKISFKGIDKENSFRIRSVVPSLAERIYDDDIEITILYGYFQIVATVELENYVAGVVETEGGYKAPIEYYKTQAILCRTYALQNFNRHIEAGYSLCDGVHCQAYKNKCKKNPEIITAAKSTAGLVLVDSTLKLITAAFHSNSGGETVNSENVWMVARSYLKAVPDPFSINQPSYSWKKIIAVSDWIKYLEKYNIKFNEQVSPTIFAFNQTTRKSDYIIKNTAIPLKNIRYDWQLRSTFFSIEPAGDSLIFRGKGYGHGIGLSQEGAMQMAREGYTYDKILHFYFKNIYIVSQEALHFFEQNTIK